MEGDAVKTKRSHHPERISLGEEALVRVERWTEQVREHLKGSRFTRSDMVNEIIKSRQEELSAMELKAIHATFFDPTRVIDWMAKQAKEAQKNGVIVDLQELLHSAGLAGPQKPRDQIKRKAKPKISLDELATGETTTS